MAFTASVFHAKYDNFIGAKSQAADSVLALDAAHVAKKC